ncbi:helix-turn-helix domain-containing protein [Georgenia yuyongxinii]
MDFGLFDGDTHRVELEKPAADEREAFALRGQALSKHLGWRDPSSARRGCAFLAADEFLEPVDVALAQMRLIGPVAQQVLRGELDLALDPGLDLRESRSLVITRTEAAQALGVDPRTVTAGIENGTIPSVRLGRRVVIPREKFLRLFDRDT